jgi:hypothetical protein
MAAANCVSSSSSPLAESNSGGETGARSAPTAIGAEQRSEFRKQQTPLAKENQNAGPRQER